MQTALARAERPFPLPSDRRAELARSVSRAATAAVLNMVRDRAGRGEDILKETWPSDVRAFGILTRTATAPATSTTAGWAAELAVTTTADAFLLSLPQSAASALFAAGLSLPLTGAAAIKVPYPGPTPSLAPSVVAEGAPIPERQAALATVTLSPRKLAVITTMTNEIAEHSTPAAEAIVRAVLTATARTALDQTVFTTSAGGLLNGVTPITATAGGGAAAFLGDVKGLTAAITTGGRIMLFMSPALMAAAAIYAPGLVTGVEIVPAPTLGTTVVAVDPAGVVSGASSDQPRIEVGKETTLHYEDTNPLQFSTGAPGSAVVATPMRSAFQTDSFSLRLLLEFAFAARPGAVAFVPTVTW